ncbi:MAG: hypothetical protein ACR2PL_22150, partial [Dehalococcoidia bacterium]
MTSGANDQLLIYLSELRSGTWSRFQAAVQATVQPQGDGDDRSYAVRAALDALGDLEVASHDANVWWVPASTLAQIPTDTGAEAVLSGSRTNRLLQRLASIPLVHTSQERGPERLLIRRNSHRELMHIAQGLQIEWNPAFSESLATLLASTEELYERAPPALAPSGWMMERFSEDGWKDVTTDREDGFYRYTNFTTEYRLNWGGTYRKLERSTGIHEYSRRTARLIVEYRSDSRTL